MQPASRKACPAKCCPQRKRLIEQEKWMYLPPILTASPNSLEYSWQCSFQISINLSNPRYQSQASLTRAVDHREERVASSQCEMTYREYTLPSERAAQKASLTSAFQTKKPTRLAHMKTFLLKYLTGLFGKLRISSWKSEMDFQDFASLKTDSKKGPPHPPKGKWQVSLEHECCLVGACPIQNQRPSQMPCPLSLKKDHPGNLHRSIEPKP